jgi:hypothetical protein
MKRVLVLIGLAGWLLGCGDSSTPTGHTGESGDTTKNMTTNSGAAGTGGVVAGFGTGGSAGTDTNTTAGAAKDTSSNGGQ